MAFIIDGRIERSRELSIRASHAKVSEKQRRKDKRRDETSKHENARPVMV